jgi:hypothetical protein
MAKSPTRVGGAVALANVLGFVALLAIRPPEYEQLRERDVERNSGGPAFMSSADPIHLAGRPFYSSAHTPVPLVEDLYFIANTPASLTMLFVGFPLASTTTALWAGSGLVSGAWESWVLALVFAAASGLWGFALGVVVCRGMRRIRQQSR